MQVAKHYVDFEYRRYGFSEVARRKNELEITMYNTPYYFVKENDVWINHSSNKFNMRVELIAALVKSLNIS